MMAAAAHSISPSLLPDSYFFPASTASVSCFCTFPPLSRKWAMALDAHIHSRKWAIALDDYGLGTSNSKTKHCNVPDRFVCCCAEGSEDGPNSALSLAVEERPEENEVDAVESPGSLSSWLYPTKEELPDDVEMSFFDHLDELRDRILVSVAVVGAAILGCFAFAKDLIVFLEAPVYSQGVRFLQLSPGEYFFTTIKVSGYTGLLLGSPVILYEIIAFVLPGLTRSERKFLGPIVLGSSVLFYSGLAFSYLVLAPAALNFFVSYAEGAVESLWSIDQYFEFILVLMFSTGLSFQVPVIQLLLGQTGLVSGNRMLSVWRYVVVGAVTAAAILTPSTDPLTQMLLAGPLIGLYLGGAFLVKLTARQPESS